MTIQTAAVVGQALNAPVRRGSLADTGLKIVKWVLIILLLAIVAGLIWFAVQLAEYDYSLTDYAESEWGVSDTGDGAFVSGVKAAFRLSPLGFLGSAVGIGVTGSGAAGMSDNVNRAKNSLYTMFKRLGGG